MTAILVWLAFGAGFVVGATWVAYCERRGKDMGLCGRYVKTFAEASHALPQGMHMNSDYPFMLPAVVAITGRTVTLHGNQGDASFLIHRDAEGCEFCFIQQSSSFEKLFRRKPHKFKTLPFKDENAKAIGV